MMQNDLTKSSWLADFFNPLEGELTNKEVWLWWEKRRLPYNGIAVITAILSFIAYCYFCGTSGALSPGEDLIEPIALLFAIVGFPVGWNVAYTFGPIVDCLLVNSGKHSGPILLKSGLCLSVLLLSSPAIFWFFQWLRLHS